MATPLIKTETRALPNLDRLDIDTVRWDAPKPKITALMNVFNESEWIRKSLFSLIHFVDEVVLADGAYRDFPSKNDISNDGTLEIIRWFEREFPNKIELHSLPRKTQIEKRTFLISQVNPQDFAFIIDGDEILAGDPQGDFNALRESGWNVAFISCVNVQDGEQHAREHPRIYHGIPGLHYTKNHYTICDGDDAPVPRQTHTTTSLGSTKILNYGGLRNSETRDNQRMEYYTKILDTIEDRG